MSQLVIGDVPDDLVERLRQRAERTGRTVEAEALAVLSNAELPAPLVRSNEPLGAALSRRLGEIGLLQEGWTALAESLEAVRSSRSDSIHRWVDFSDWPVAP